MTAYDTGFTTNKQDRLGGAHAYATVSKTAPSGVWEQFYLSGETYDTDGYHDTGTNPDRFTVPAGRAGRYRVEACVSYDANATGLRQISIMKNGTIRSGIRAVASVGGTYRTRVHTVDYLVLAVGDYIRYESFQDSGSALEIGVTTGSSGLANETWGAIHYLGA